MPDFRGRNPKFSDGDTLKADSVNAAAPLAKTRHKKPTPSAPVRQSTRARKQTSQFNVATTKGKSYFAFLPNFGSEPCPSNLASSDYGPYKVT